MTKFFNFAPVLEKVAAIDLDRALQRTSDQVVAGIAAALSAAVEAMWRAERFVIIVVPNRVMRERTFE